MTDNLENDEELDDDYNFWHFTVSIVSGANLAGEKEIKASIKDLNALIDTGYYDDEAGNELMKHVVSYLKGKLE